MHVTLGMILLLCAAQTFAAEATTQPAAGWGEPADQQFQATTDGTTQRYVQMLPASFDPQQRHDVLVVLHGHGSDRWQYVRDKRDECQGARDVALRHQMIYISPDYRASTSWMGPAAEADVVQLIGLVRKEHRVGRVYLCGASMGGASSLIFSALHPELVDGVISQNGTANMIDYDQFQDAIRASYGGDKQQAANEYRKRSPELTPEAFTMPVAFTVGGKDRTVEPASVRRLADLLKQQGKTKVLMIDRPEGGHSTNYQDTAAAIEFVITFAEANN